RGGGLQCGLHCNAATEHARGLLLQCGLHCNAAAEHARGLLLQCGLHCNAAAEHARGCCCSAACTATPRLSTHGAAVAVRLALQRSRLGTRAAAVCSAACTATLSAGHARGGG